MKTYVLKIGLGNIFIGSAKKTIRTFNCKNIDCKISKNKNGQNEKPWFDQDSKGVGPRKVEFDPIFKTYVFIIFS
jgi:hypothetical protein